MLESDALGQPPYGLNLKTTLRGHSNLIYLLAWSPDGHTLASSSMDRTIILWDTKTWEVRRYLADYPPWGKEVSWSPDSRILASGVGDGTIILWDSESGRRIKEVRGHGQAINWLSWSPDGRTLASGGNKAETLLWDSSDWRPTRLSLDRPDALTRGAWSPDGRYLALCSERNIFLWDAGANKLSRTLGAQGDKIQTFAWSPDGESIASGSSDGRIRLWGAADGQQVLVLEGHTGSVSHVAFSPDGRFLASKSGDHSVRLWLCESWDTVTKFAEASRLYGGLAFHPQSHVLASLGMDAHSIRIWELDAGALESSHTVPASRRYSNAKVVLVGDTGVGKSGLALVLLNQPFVPTDSTHGRHVWIMESKDFESESGVRETHEVLLWDLAGQPGYRLIHQLHLNEVAVALIVFDARSDTDPFSVVHHWDRALRQAQAVQGDAVITLKKFLVAARCDRGGVSVGKARIDALVRELGFDGYLETSAKEGWKISELKQVVLGAIDWQSLPKVNSTELFQRMKEFLIEEKPAGRLLSTEDDLYRSFVLSGRAEDRGEVSRAEFETCVGRLESRDIIQRLSFGNLVLLQAELRDSYASAIVNAAKEEPDGMGYIEEDRVKEGRFPMPQTERIKNAEQEKLLLIATVEDLLRHEIALREQTDTGSVLVFPSQLTRENPDLPDPEGKAVTFVFDGPLLNIYSTLAVRLSHSGFFKKKDMWRNATTYTPKAGGTCGISLRQLEEGRGELTVFFDKKASKETRTQFEDYIHAHLTRRALPESIRRKRIIVCPTCEAIVTERTASDRRGRGYDFLNCPVCDARVSLADSEEAAEAGASASVVYKMDMTADGRRTREAAVSIVEGKQETGDFDVFLCHNNADKLAIKEISDRLKQYGVLPWLDVEQLRPGVYWQEALEAQISNIKTAAVFVGKNSIGPWQDMELRAFLREFVKRGCMVIPVILEDSLSTPQLPSFLQGMMWVDFRKDVPNPMEQLLWGITGKRGLVTEYTE